MARMKPTTRAFAYGLAAGAVLLGIVILLVYAWWGSTDSTLQKLGGVGGFLSGVGIVFAALAYFLQIAESRRNRRADLQSRYLAIFKDGVQYFGEMEAIPIGDSPADKAIKSSIFMRGLVMLVSMDIFLAEFLDTGLFDEPYKVGMKDNIARALDGTLDVLALVDPRPFDPSPFVYISRLRKEHQP